MSALSPGTVIAGDFRVLRPLSAGGMSAVYVAHQISTNRERALKVMLGELAGHEDLKARFVQEATIGSQIDSDHAVEPVARQPPAQQQPPRGRPHSGRRPSRSSRRSRSHNRVRGNLSQRGGARDVARSW